MHLLTASCISGTVRLRVSENDFVPLPLQRYLIDDELSVGRVEVCLGGRFGTICDTGTIFDDSDASVVCQQLGFSRYGELKCVQLPLACVVINLVVRYLLSNKHCK